LGNPLKLIEETMRIPELDAIDAARKAIDEIVATRYLGVQAVPGLAPTDFGMLPPAMQEAELRMAEDAEIGNRLRAGIHMCLSAASVALELSQTLIGNFPALDRADRAKALLKCAEDALAASDAARHAAAVLAGEEKPETDAFFEISRI
jgi:predicted signal transduction protein with EAL and GGDEF domain